MTRCHLERINVTPVKGLGLQHPDAVELTGAGVESNRRFYLTSAGRMYNGKDHGPLLSVRALFEQGRLTLTFPGGEELVGEVALAERVETDFWGRTVTGRVVLGPWSEALSAYAGVAIRLVQTERPGTATDIEISNNDVVDNALGFSCAGTGVIKTATNNRKSDNLGGVSECAPSATITVQ